MISSFYMKLLTDRKSKKLAITLFPKVIKITVISQTECRNMFFEADNKACLSVIQLSHIMPNPVRAQISCYCSLKVSNDCMHNTY